MLSPNFWRKYFKVYDFLNELEPYQSLLGQFVIDLGNIQGKEVLDVGVGTGNLAVLLNKKGASITGLDFSKEGLDFFKKKVPDGKVVFHNLRETLPFKDSYFDYIVSNNTIYTLPKENHLRVLRELFRVMKPGGKIIISNLRVGFKPYKIYLEHIKWGLKNSGAFKVLLSVLYFAIPSLKIFYYNFLISRENSEKNYNFFHDGEQKMLLSKVGFINVSGDKLVYAEQAIMNSGYKFI